MVSPEQHSFQILVSAVVASFSRGGFLALVKPNGVAVPSFYNYGQQTEDVSYGTLGQAQSVGFFGTPTPGSTNRAPQGMPVTEKPTFSLDDQVITGTVSLQLTATSPTALPPSCERN